MTTKFSTRKSIAIKICGITNSIQAKIIAELGVNAIGVIGVKNSPRFVTEKEMAEIFNQVKSVSSNIERVLVIANMRYSEITKYMNSHSAPSVLQLHGDESPNECASIKNKFPSLKLWKSFRVRNQRTLETITQYENTVDALLLDAWHPYEIGGTGERIPIQFLKNIRFKLPWWLAGGISADSIPELLAKIHPHGIDASSRLERSPGYKDIKKVEALVEAIRNLSI